MSQFNDFKSLYSPSMSGSHQQLYHSISSTPTSGSPVDIFGSGFFDDDEDTSSDGRSRRPSDETDNGFHLPVFPRAVGTAPTSNPTPVMSDLDSLTTLQQAVTVFRAMNRGDSNGPPSSVIESSVALENLKALAQITQISEPPRTIGGNFYSRQGSLPVDTLFPPPCPPMYSRGPTMNGHQLSNYGWSTATQPMPNGGFSSMTSYRPNRPSFNQSMSMPMGNPEISRMTGMPDSLNMMEMRTKFGSLGMKPGMFNAPHGFCTGRNEEIIVADTHNHRIQVFDKRGNFRFCFGEPGKEEGCLWYPRKVAVFRSNGFFVVCDRGLERSRMQLFNEHGMFVKRITISFVDIVAGIAITPNDLIVLIDSVRPTLFIIDPVSGDLVCHFECAEYMTEPSDVAVYNNQFYICDFKGHSVVVLAANGQFLRKISTQGVSLFPNGIDISDQGDVLVGDSHGNQFHVAIFNSNGDFVSHFMCPQVKVSRCCGLKITAEGHIITLAKNNHHVLVLNTLFV